MKEGNSDRLKYNRVPLVSSWSALEKHTCVPSASVASQSLAQMRGQPRHT